MILVNLYWIGFLLFLLWLDTKKERPEVVALGEAYGAAHARVALLVAALFWPGFLLWAAAAWSWWGVKWIAWWIATR